MTINLEKFWVEVKKASVPVVRQQQEGHGAMAGAGQPAWRDRGVAQLVHCFSTPAGRFACAHRVRDIFALMAKPLDIKRDPC